MSSVKQLALSLALLAAPSLVLSSPPQPGQAQQDLIFDVRNGDQRGKLLIKDDALSFESLTDARQSRTWNYSDLREVSRKRREVSVKPFKGSKYSFQFPDNAIRDRIYTLISDRVVSARQQRKK
jgi:hypothetical protein